MKLLNNPKSIIGRYVYYEGCSRSRRFVTGIKRHNLDGIVIFTVLCKNDDGSDNSGPFEAYTIEPNGRYLTLQDLQ